MAPRKIIRAKAQGVGKQRGGARKQRNSSPAWYRSAENAYLISVRQALLPLLLLLQDAPALACHTSTPFPRLTLCPFLGPYVCMHVCRRKSRCYCCQDRRVPRCCMLQNPRRRSRCGAGGATMPGIPAPALTMQPAGTFISAVARIPMALHIRACYRHWRVWFRTANFACSNIRTKFSPVIPLLSRDGVPWNPCLPTLLQGLPCPPSVASLPWT